MNEQSLNFPQGKRVSSTAVHSGGMSEEAALTGSIYQHDFLIDLIKEVVATELLQHEFDALTASNSHHERTDSHDVQPSLTKCSELNHDPNQCPNQSHRAPMIAEKLRKARINQDNLYKRLKLNSRESWKSETYRQEPEDASSISERPLSGRRTPNTGECEPQSTQACAKGKQKIRAHEEDYTYLKASHENLKENFNKFIEFTQKQLFELDETVKYFSHRVLKLQYPGFKIETVASSPSKSTNKVPQIALTEIKLATEAELQKIRSEIEDFSGKLEDIKSQLEEANSTIRSLSSLKDDHEMLVTGLHSMNEFQSLVENHLHDSRNQLHDSMRTINDKVISCEQKFASFDTAIADLHRCVSANQDSEHSASAQAKETCQSLDTIVRKHTEQIGTLHGQLGVWIPIVNRNDHSIRSLDARYSAINTESMFKGIVALLEARNPVISHVESGLSAVRRQIDDLHQSLQTTSEKVNQHTTRLAETETFHKNLDSALADISNLKCSAEAVTSDVLQLYGMRAAVKSLKQDLGALGEQCVRLSEMQEAEKALAELQTKTQKLEESLKESSEKYNAHDRSISDANEQMAEIHRRYHKAMKNGDYLKNTIETLQAKFSAAKAELNERLDWVERFYEDRENGGKALPECPANADRLARELTSNDSEAHPDDSSSKDSDSLAVEKHTAISHLQALAKNPPRRDDSKTTEEEFRSKSLLCTCLGPATTVDYVEKVIFAGYDFKCVSITKNSDRNCSALVETYDPEEAVIALRQLSGKSVDGRRISIELATPESATQATEQRSKDCLVKTDGNNSQQVIDEDTIVVDLTREDELEDNELLSLDMLSDTKHRNKEDQEAFNTDESRRSKILAHLRDWSMSPKETAHSSNTSDEEVTSLSQNRFSKSSSENSRKRQRMTRNSNTSTGSSKSRKRTRRSK